ncbi:MerR family transcriptional regulator [Oscillospiraceae bacterium PP1C4]
MEYTVQKLAGLAGVSARTLRYYDEIGLLNPCRVSSNGYRIYGQSEVDLLQQILFYRELGLGLAEIEKLIKDPSIDRLSALREYRIALDVRQKRLNLLIDNVNKTIQKEEGRIIMTDKEKFEGFKKELIEKNEKQYGKEMRESYGVDTIAASNARMMKLSQAEYENMQSLAEKINALLEKAVQENADPAGKSGREIAALHKEWLTFTWPKYTKEAHAGLAEMYVSDERFTACYDKNIKGCALFLRDAVLAWLELN